VRGACAHLSLVGTPVPSRRSCSIHWRTTAGSALPLAYASWPDVQALFGNGTVLIVSAMAAIGLIVGHVLGGPDPDDRTVLVLSTTSRHPVIALSVAVGAGAEMKAQIGAILIYLIVAGLVSIPYAAWRRHASKADHAADISDHRFAGATTSRTRIWRPRRKKWRRAQSATSIIGGADHSAKNDWREYTCSTNPDN
jgi:hypothetical protein